MKENIGVYRGIFIYTRYCGWYDGQSKPQSILALDDILNHLLCIYHFIFVGTLFLFILNMIFNPKLFDGSFYSGHTIDYHWWVGGLLGVCFLTGNLLLLPRLGAALTVVMTVAGQIIMGSS